MKHLMTLLVFSFLVVGINSPAIARKQHKAKLDSASMQDSVSTYRAAPIQSSADNNAGKIFGMSILGFIFLLWIVPSIIPAIIASSKGRSGLGIFLLSIFFTPIIGLIVALLMQSGNKTKI